MDKCLYVVNVEAALFKDDRWLLGKRSSKEDHAPGEISMVGWKVENATNENNILEETLKREVLEEVGVEIRDNIRYVKSSTFVASFGKTVVDIVFLCEYKSGQAKALDPNELDGVEWLTLDEVLSNKDIGEYTKEALKIAAHMRNAREGWTTIFS